MTLTMDGRATTFATLYEQHYGAVRAYASRRVGADAADEVAAETFLIAWRSDAVPDEPLPWLYGVARNVGLRHHEGIRRQTRARGAPNESAPRQLTPTPPGTPRFGRHGTACDLPIARSWR